MKITVPSHTQKVQRTIINDSALKQLWEQKAKLATAMPISYVQKEDRFIPVYDEEVTKLLEGLDELIKQRIGQIENHFNNENTIDNQH